MTRYYALAALLLALCALPCRAAGEPLAPVKVLDDFETGGINWTGAYLGSVVDEYPSHGKRAFKVVFQKGVEYPGISAAKIDLDWSGYDTLKIDVYNPQSAPVNLAIRIDDGESTGYYSRYNGEFLLVNGQTFLEIPFAEITASGRPLDLAGIGNFTIFMSSPMEDTTLYFDNVRLTRGSEGDATRGRIIAGTAESPQVRAALEKATAARDRLAALVPLAHQSGIGTLEANIALITADLGLRVRPDLPWYQNRKGELYAYVADSSGAAYEGLKATLEGSRVISPIPPISDASRLEFKGPYLVQKGRGASPAPVLLFSMLYHREGPLCEYFTPINYFTHTHSFGGASRYDVERTPVYRAYKAYPDTHRVWNGDESWCGHIVRDSSSLGGGKEPVVICLESPHTRRAIEQYIRQNAPKWKTDPNIHVNILGGELSYICYCKYTLDMFRRYLRDQYKSIAALNAAWGVDFASFDDVAVMPGARQAAENRARWYDWQAFNCYRFVEHAKWVKSVIRSIDEQVPVSVGAVSYSFRTGFGRSGVDEENLIRQVDDVVLNEAGPSTIATDLLWSLSEGKKPMFDFEYHGDVAGILPHFLHGNAAMAMWWWPAEPDTEFPQFNETALPYSWNIPLSDVAESLKIALDIRRIPAEITAFAAEPAEIAILYSRASMLQVPPEFASATDTPYTMELNKVYDASLGLDAPVRFVSSIQVREGQLARYKVLVVPGAPYVYDDVADAVWKFAENGGSLVITPNSFMFDQYARPRNHLAKIGVEVKSVAEPKYDTEGETRDAFLQEMIRPTTAEGAPVIAVTFGLGGILPEGAALKGQGAFQTLELSGRAKAVASTADGRPAFVEIPYGKGTVYYLAVGLLPESMNALLDAVAERAGVKRPVRFALASGSRDWRIEGRAVGNNGITLFYVVNRTGAPARIKAALPYAPEGVLDLRDPWRKVDPSSIELAPGRTGIFAAREKASKQ